MKINHSLLLKTFAAFGIPVANSELVLFSIRGMRPLGNHSHMRESWNLLPAKLDYKHMHCSIGIWSPKRRKLFVAPGSSVPHWDEVIKAAALNGKGANQLESGFYSDFYKGEHLMGKTKGHQALRQTAYRFLRRSHHKPPYTVKDPLYFSNPYDNLHCSWNPNPGKAGYSSAGCIVVSGHPHCKRIKKSPPNSGSWKSFHKLIYAAKQSKYSLLLLNSHNLKKIASKKRTPDLLCFGSEGESVKKLQRMLKSRGLYRGPLSGKLGVRTYRAWNVYGFRKK